MICGVKTMVINENCKVCQIKRNIDKYPLNATEEEIKEKAIEVAKMYSATENDKMVDLLMQSQQAALRADVMRNKTLNLILGK